MLSIGVIGYGTWATALSKILTDNNNSIYWWIRRKEILSYIETHHHNPKYLSSVSFDKERIICSSDIVHVIKKSNVLFLALPSAFVYDILSNISPKLFEDTLVVCSIKGIISESNATPVEFFNTHFNIDIKNIVVLGGPCHAEEIAMERKSYITLGSHSKNNTTVLKNILSNHYINIHSSKDIEGIEYASVLKNIYAIGAGIYYGLGYGDNFHSVFVANCVKEMQSFLSIIKPINRDINHSVYLGDLLVTTYSNFSRNRKFGNMIGKGYSVANTKLEMNMIAEGYYAVKSIVEINTTIKANIPIVSTIYSILYEGANPSSEMESLSKIFY